MKKLFFTLIAAMVLPVLAMAQCPTPSSVNASVTFKRHIPSTVDGDFSVSSTTKVRFSEGNLQYDSDNQKWQFAAHQYDYIGNAAGNTSVTDDGLADDNGVADLFGWVGASSVWNTEHKQHGLTSSKEANATDGYGNNASDKLKSDWGTVMGSGWRTLTSAEWTYLFNTRSGSKASTVNGTANTRYAKATVNGKCGVILFPDGGTFTAGEFTAVSSLNTANAAYTSTRCSSDEWDKLEEKGCVFLPAAGYRIETSVSNAGANGRYWSSTVNTATYAEDFNVTLDNVTPQYVDYRYMGCSVRLVCNVQ